MRRSQSTGIVVDLADPSLAHVGAGSAGADNVSYHFENHTKPDPSRA